MPRLAENGRPPESVWEYPRPPAVEPCARRVRVEHAGEVIADSGRALRVLETASPPTIYVPAADIRIDLLCAAGGQATVCEWKGAATYFDVGPPASAARRAAWTYEAPREPYARLRDHYAFYAGRVACCLDDEEVTSQAGSFYGGWVTAEIEGPMKGDPGTGGW